MTLPQNQAAWLTGANARPLQVGLAPMPAASAQDNQEVVIQVHSVAINPADPIVQQRAMAADQYPYIMGLDMAGIVHAVGPQNTRFEVGDRVIGLAVPTVRNSGGFQLYSASHPRALARIPDGVSFNEGCVLPLGLSTAAESLFEKDALALDLPKPGGSSVPNGQILLVWGGASSVGACAIQLAKAAGYTIAATASTKNFGLLREIGVEYVFDYSRDRVVDEIVAALEGKGRMAGVFCAVFDTEVVSKCAAVALRLEGRRHVGTVGHPPMENWPEGVEISSSWALKILDSEVGNVIWGEWLEGALKDGSMKCRPPYEVVGGGLDALQGAVDLMGKGVSAKKLVVEIVH